MRGVHHNGDFGNNHFGDYMMQTDGGSSSWYDQAVSYIDETVASIQGFSKEAIENAYSDFYDLINKRKTLFEAISSMPEGAAKENMKAEFLAQEGVVTTYILPAMNKVFTYLGETSLDTSLPRGGQFGFLPAIWAAFVGAPIATQVIVATALLGVTAYISSVGIQYSAMLARPELAKYAASVSSPFSEIGTGVKWGLILVAGLIGFSFIKRN